MSYDLYFTASPAPEPAAFFEYFKARSHYTIKGLQAWYENETTGVYFSFELPDSDEEGEPGSWAAFNLNDYRPHCFADEALVELEAFCGRFGNAIANPQNDGMGRGPFSADGFLRAWEAGNHVACKVMAERADEPPIVRPGDEIRRVWEWNYRRDALQKELGEDIFVPQVIYVRSPMGVQTASVWTDGIPVVLPRTEAVMIFRDDLAPRRFLFKVRGMPLMPWSAVDGWTAGYKRVGEPIEHHYLNWEETPREVWDTLKSLPVEPDLERITTDRLLEAEVASQFRFRSLG